MARHRFFDCLAWVSVCATTVVIVALTLGKAWFQIGYLWVPARQRVRELELQPLDMLGSGSWFAPLFDYAGNACLFLPFGLLCVVLGKRRWPRPVLRSMLCALVLSLSIEIAQYLFRLGRTDIDDLVFNTLGATLGAWLAVMLGPRWHRVWVALCLLSALIFMMLVILGPNLGDPAKVVDL